MRIELLLFLSFLALVIVMIACSAPRRPSPAMTSTLFSPLSLTTYDPRLVGRVSMEADIATTMMPAKPRLPELEISPPRCFRTIAPQLTCIGVLYNRASSALSEISLAARFSVDDSMPGAGNVFLVEQRRIPAGEKAPYRLHLPDAGDEDAALEISLADARFAPATEYDLTFEEQGAEYTAAENSYRLRGLLWNESDATVTDMRLVITLEDGAGAIIGYRALDLAGALAVNASRAVDISITPLEYSAELGHRMIAQAVRAD